MATVNEAWEYGYCDTTLRMENLDFVGTVGGVKVYIAPTIPERQTVFQAKMPGAHFD